MRKILTTLLLGFGALNFIRAATGSPEKHVVVVVWDGMRPDFVNATNTPTLQELAKRGVFFSHNHSVYLSSTEVNGAALATGDYPQHNSVIGNREFRPDIDPFRPIATESLDAMRKGDEHGNYLSVPTLAEILQKQGYRTAIAGTKPVVLLHDRAARPDDAANAILFEGRALPSSRLPNIVQALGPFPDSGETKTNRDLWTTRALIEHLWETNVPAFSLLWLAEPDSAQHATGVGSARALVAMRHSDYALSLVIAALKAKGVYETTDIFVVSDHGFSTISGSVNIVARLRQGGFNAAREFSTSSAKGDVLAVGLGGSVLLYVNGHDEKTVARLISFLQTDDSVGVIFTAREQKGTFALDEALLHSANAPDVAFSFRWTDATNRHGAAGLVIAEGQGGNPPPTAPSLRGTHVSLSQFDLHNTLIAAGPDFRKGMMSETPSGNVDVAPTILKIFGIKPSQPMDGRILFEALNSTETNSPVIARKELHANAVLPDGEWTQSLSISEVNGVRYLDKGNGQFVPHEKK